MKSSSLLILVASALFLSALSPSPQPSPTPTPGPTTERQTEQSKAANASAQANTAPTQVSPITIQIVPSPKFEDESSNAREKRDYEKRQYRLNFWQTLFNGILAAFTTLLVLIGAYQGYQLRRTVDATREAAEAAKKSADVAEQSLEISQAAHVTIGNVTISGIEIQSVEYDLHNSGRLSGTEVTPMIFTSCKAEIDFPPVRFREITDILRGLIVAPNETWHGTYPPNTEFIAVHDGDAIPLERQQVIDVLDGKLILYVEVGVNYRNGFGRLRHFARGFVFDVPSRTFRHLQDVQR